MERETGRRITEKWCAKFENFIFKGFSLCLAEKDFYPVICRTDPPAQGKGGAAVILHWTPFRAFRAANNLNCFLLLILIPPNNRFSMLNDRRAHGWYNPPFCWHSDAPCLLIIYGHEKGRFFPMSAKILKKIWMPPKHPPSVTDWQELYRLFPTNEPPQL